MANGLDGYEEPNTTNYFKEANVVDSLKPYVIVDSVYSEITAKTNKHKMYST